MENSLMHLYKGIYCLNKDPKLNFVHFNKWNLTDLGVFFSKWKFLAICNLLEDESTATEE